MFEQRRSSRGRRIALVAALGAAVAVSLGSAGPAIAGGTESHPVIRKALTWTVNVQNPLGPVLVGHSSSDPYTGDTPVFRSLPMLCFYSVPDEITPPDGVILEYYPGWAMPAGYYSGWSRGWVAVTPPIRGTELTSLAVADQTCANYFGEGWRMAEFHDGWWNNNGTYEHGGWHFWAHGVVPAGVRFWVHINDQPANPWGSDS